MRITIPRVAALALFLLCQSALARECIYEKGEARWEIKTGLPAGALNRDARTIDLQALMDLENPHLTAAQKGAIADQRWSEKITIGSKSLREGDLVTVAGFLYHARCQTDGDYHLEIGTSSSSGRRCLIVEVPDPGQVPNRSLRRLVTRVRGRLDKLPSRIFTGKGNPISVTVTGQLFLDSQHLRRDNPKTGKKGDPSGGRGTKFNGKNCATNVWEIHPMTELLTRGVQPRSSRRMGGASQRGTPVASSSVYSTVVR
jgi:hypothetical protein